MPIRIHHGDILDADALTALTNGLRRAFADGIVALAMTPPLDETTAQQLSVMLKSV